MRCPAADVKDDTRADGLLDHAVQCDPETLKPAMNAALGKSQTGGRLVWEISLPESMNHCEDANLAVILPEWDVRRGRTHINYSGKQVSVELYGGKSLVISGQWQTSIDVDDNEQSAVGDWILTCDYSDDDVHYLELEQVWSGGITLQRHVLVVRDDRCVLMADSVLPTDLNDQSQPQHSLHELACRWPIR